MHNRTIGKRIVSYRSRCSREFNIEQHRPAGECPCRYFGVFSQREVNVIASPHVRSHDGEIIFVKRATCDNQIAHLRRKQTRTEAYLGSQRARFVNIDRGHIAVGRRNVIIFPPVALGVGVAAPFRHQHYRGGETQTVSSQRRRCSRSHFQETT